MTSRIDLHAHSLASDGTDTPGDLVRAGRAAGLDVMAITDHDTSRGWQETAEVALEVGVGLVRGMEISTTHSGRSVHLLAYLLDPTHPALVAELQSIIDGRNGRVPGIVARLREAGVMITEADVQRHASSTAAAGRPHVADALVELGHVHHRNDAFAQWLNPGRPAYVRRHAPAVADMVRTVRSAGGVPVIAHPWGRGGRASCTPELFAELKGAGLLGIEVDHHDHSPADREALRGLARDLDLLVTGGSDHHGTGKIGHDLGVHTTAPEQYERLVDLAGRVGRESGRQVPAVVVPD